MKHVVKIIFIAFLIFFLIPCGADATTIQVDFTRITSNSSIDLAAQLWLDILDPLDASSYIPRLNDDQVLFLFGNQIGIPSNIAEIYIDDGTILGLSSVYNNLGGSTSFDIVNPLNPSNLPGGEALVPPFVATQAYSIDSDDPPNSDGIDAPDDILGIVYDLESGLTIDDVQDALSDGSLRIGLHVRSIADPLGTLPSDSFVNTDGVPDVPVPEPSTLLFLGFGLLSLPFFKRKEEV